MYKSFKFKKYGLAFNIFPKTAKNLNQESKPYVTGFRFWDSFDHKTYALVLGTFRIMFYVDTGNGEVCGSQ